MTKNDNTIKIQKLNKKIEMLRQKLETISKDKSLSDPEMLKISNELDKEIIKYMKLYGKLKS